MEINRDHITNQNDSKPQERSLTNDHEKNKHLSTTNDTDKWTYPTLHLRVTTYGLPSAALQPPSPASSAPWQHSQATKQENVYHYHNADEVNKDDRKSLLQSVSGVVSTQDSGPNVNPSKARNTKPRATVTDGRNTSNITQR